MKLWQLHLTEQEVEKQEQQTPHYHQLDMQQAENKDHHSMVAVGSSVQLQVVPHMPEDKHLAEQQLHMQQHLIEQKVEQVDIQIDW